jgi:hypothetical protein
MNLLHPATVAHGIWLDWTQEAAGARKRRRVAAAIGRPRSKSPTRACSLLTPAFTSGRAHHD